jgi:hypothetical protein
MRNDAQLRRSRTAALQKLRQDFRRRIPMNGIRTTCEEFAMHYKKGIFSPLVCRAILRAAAATAAICAEIGI